MATSITVVSNQLTVDEFKNVLPDKLKKTVNQDLIDNINSVISEPELYENYRNNLLSHTQVMKEGRFKLTDYIDAVKYVSHKLMNRTNLDSYRLTFPVRYQRHVAKGISAKDIASYVSSYNKNILVNLVFAQTMIPTHVLNQDLYQKALNVQADLMMNANSEKVKTDAANSLLTHLKVPETNKIELDIGIKEDSSIDALRKASMELAAKQRLAVQSGQMNAAEIAQSVIESEDAVIVEEDK